MVKDFLKNILVFGIAFVICVGVLVVVCKIPQSAIHEESRVASEYFTDNAGFPVLLKGQANTRIDNYADCVLFNVIYNVNEDRALYSVIAAPYYRNDGEDARKDYATAVIDGKEPNNEYSRYWHGSQVLIRPLLTFASIEGIRQILFGILIALNIVLAALLIRRKQYAPALIYFVSLILVQFWMCAFTIEYIMSFLVMTAACIAVVFVWAQQGERHRGASGEADQLSAYDNGDGSVRQTRDKRMTYIFIVSGLVTCFLDFLTAETLTFTVPFILFLLLCKSADGSAMTTARLSNGRDGSGSLLQPETFRTQFLHLIKWGCAWLISYAAMFGIKWALVYAVAGKAAFVNALESAAYRMEGAVALEGPDGAAAGEAVVEAATAGQRLLLGLLRNIACLLPGSGNLSAGAIIGITIGILAVLGAVLYLFRGEKLDGVFVGILLLVAAIPYLRYLCLSNHAYIHYFFTYRAQMAVIMAIIAIMVYNLKPSYILSQREGGGNASGGKPTDRKKGGGGAAGGKSSNRKSGASRSGKSGKGSTGAAKNKKKKR